MLTDAHLHLDLFPDYLEAIREIEANAIHTIAVTNTPSVFKKTCEISKNSKYIYPALGLHPELVKTRHSEFYLFEELCKTTRFIGEVGLDFSSPNTEDIAKQEEIFKKIINLTALPDKVLSIHSRRSADRVIELIGADFPGTIILHWFTGSIKALAKAIERKFYFSINPIMTFTEKGLEIIKNIPIEQILLESDAPLASIQNRQARPLDVQIAIEPLFKIYKRHDIEDQIMNNFMRIIEL